MNDMVFCVNTEIHKAAGLSKSDFLNKVRYVEAIRYTSFQNMIEKPEDICLYLYDQDNLLKIEYLHKAINTGNMNCFDTHKYFFGINVPRNLFKWFSNTSLSVIQKQIIVWLTALWLVSPEKRHVFKDQICFQIYDEMESVAEKYFDRELFEDQEYVFSGVPDGSAWEKKVLKNYKKASVSYAGCDVPDFLKKIKWPREQYTGWGISNKCGLEYNLLFEVIYFTSTDWDKIIKKDSDDALWRCESDDKMWSLFLSTYKLADMRGSHVYSLFADEVKPCFVYLIRSGQSSDYKIGWTFNEEDIEKRCVAGYFKASSPKTQKVLHRMFQANRLMGEWFSLSDEVVGKILDPDWRSMNCIF